MKNIVKTIILIVSIILLYLQFRYVNKVNNKFDILQVDNPNKTQFENILKPRSPTVFTDVSRNFYNLQKYPCWLIEFFSCFFFCHKLYIYLIFFSLGELLVIIFFIKYDSKNK